MHEDWLQQLKAAYQAGYYKTEADRDQQSGFPWQNKTCADCPFWLNEVCRVYAERRAADADTCSYFEPANHPAAAHVIAARMNAVWKRIWEWRERRGP